MTVEGWNYKTVTKKSINFNRDKSDARRLKLRKTFILYLDKKRLAVIHHQFLRGKKITVTYKIKCIFTFWIFFLLPSLKKYVVCTKACYNGPIINKNVRGKKRTIIYCKTFGYFSADIGKLLIFYARRKKKMGLVKFTFFAISLAIFNRNWIKYTIKKIQMHFSIHGVSLDIKYNFSRLNNVQDASTGVF